MAMITNDQGQTISVSFNLFDLKQLLQMKLGKELSWAQIARETKLHRNTIERIANNQTHRTDLKTIAKLLLFFRSKGMNVDISELLVVSISEENHESQGSQDL